MTDQPPYQPPTHWHRPDPPQPTWADRWWWVPIALLATWILLPVWAAAFKAGGWQRPLAACSLALVLVGFLNLTRRRRWFRHYATRQEDRR